MTAREPTVWHPDSWPLHSRIAVALTVVGVLLIGCVATSAVMLVETRETQDLVVNDYYDSLRTSQNYFLALVDSETAVRGYALSGEPSMLDPLTAVGPPSERPLRPEIVARLPDDRIPTAKLKKVEDAANTWYTTWPSRQSPGSRPVTHRLRPRSRPVGPPSTSSGPTTTATSRICARAGKRPRTTSAC